MTDWTVYEDIFGPVSDEDKAGIDGIVARRDALARAGRSNAEAAYHTQNLAIYLIDTINKWAHNHENREGADVAIAVNREALGRVYDATRRAQGHDDSGDIAAIRSMDKESKMTTYAECKECHNYKTCTNNTGERTCETLWTRDGNGKMRAHAYAAPSTTSKIVTKQINGKTFAGKELVTTLSEMARCARTGDVLAIGDVYIDLFFRASDNRESLYTPRGAVRSSALWRVLTTCEVCYEEA